MLEISDYFLIVYKADSKESTQCDFNKIFSKFAQITSKKAVRNDTSQRNSLPIENNMKKDTQR